MLYDLGTGTQRELTFGTGWQRVWDFSPDGCRILFTSSDGSQPASLYTAKLDGSDVQTLVQADGTSGAWEPQWGSADKIAYTFTDNTANTVFANYLFGWESGTINIDAVEYGQAGQVTAFSGHFSVVARNVATGNFSERILMVGKFRFHQ